tara:strand:+ start:7349 stop:8839 length:1491 start_codon:yes stop_codon:yes gene_type:complete
MQFNTIAQIQTKKYDAFGGKFFDSDMIAAAYDAGKPHVFDRIMGQVFSSTDMFNGKPLLGMTMAKKGGSMEIDTDVYRWKLVGAQEKATRSVEVLDGLDVTGSTPGINKTPFRIKIDEGWYSYPDVIEPEHDDYKLEIVDGPIQDGTGYIYTVKLQTDSFSKFLPAEYLSPGMEFTKAWTSVGNEFNEFFGTMQFGSSFELECQIGAFANEFTVTDRLVREDNRMIGMPIPFRNKAGKVEYKEKFMHVAQMKLENRLYTDIEMQMWKGEKTTSVDDRTGYFKRTGPGVRQQLRDGHTFFYNGALTESELEDYLDGIFFSRVSQGDRKITAMTGSMGAIAFHNLLAASANSFLTVDSNYIQRVGKGPVRHLSYGAQFTHYQGLNGIEVDLMLNPLNDDVHFCKRTHPLHPNKPVDSWRMTFLDFGSADNESNIQMLKVKDTRRWGYLEGTIDYKGAPIKGGSLRSKKAGVEFITEGTAGIWIKDVTRGGEFIFDPEY